MQPGLANHGDWHNYSNENKGYHPQDHVVLEPPPPKGYGDWDKEEVAKYRKDRDLERRPTLGGSLMTLVKSFTGSDRR